MSQVFYFPGRAGDALHQWPIAHHWWKTTQKPFQVWLDQPTCKMLEPLFAAQPGVELVKLVNESKAYNIGGQPWAGDFPTSVHAEHQITSLGMRQFPQVQITLQTADWMPFRIDRHDLADDNSLETGAIDVKNRLVLHGTFRTHGGGTPGFWRTLADHRHDLEDTFEEITFVGSVDDLQRATALYPEWSTFEDGGDFLKLARFVDESRMVLAAGSCVAALGQVLHVPTVRVHDEIGNAPKVIWSGLGDHQWNETERELRRSLPGILASLGVPA